MALKSLRVALVYAVGAVGTFARLHLALQLTGVVFANGARARGSVASRETGFTDFDVDDPEVRALCAAAEEAGFADRLPDVREVVDTSERSAQVLLWIAHEHGAHVLTLTLMSSGFEGPDAPALRRFFARLLARAPALDPSIRLDLTGNA